MTRRAMTTLSPLSRRGSLALLGAISAASAYIWFGVSSQMWWLMGMLLTSLGAMTAGAFVPRFGAQVLVRGGLFMKLTWIVFVLVMLIANVVFGSTPVSRLWSSPSLVMWLLCGGLGTMALALGRRGLSERSPYFSPHSNKGPLMLSLIMGVADTLLLLLGLIMMGVAMFNGSMPSLGLMATLLGLFASMCIALFGVYRLRVWGTVLMLVTNVVVVGAIAYQTGLDDDLILAAPFILTTLVQFGLFARLMKMIRASSSGQGEAVLQHASSSSGHDESSGVILDHTASLQGVAQVHEKVVTQRS